MAEETTVPVESAPQDQAAIEQPTETPEPAATEAPPVEAQPTTEGQPAANPRRDTKAERRISTLTQRNMRAERTITQLKQRQQELEQKLASMPAPEDDLDTASIVNHAVKTSQLEGEIANTARQIESTQTDVQSELLEDISVKVAAFQEKVPDYSESVQQLAGLPNLALSAAQVDNMPEVYYALSKNLPLAAHINSLPETARLIELGKLSVSVAPPNNNRVSSAPPPVASAQSGGSTPPKVLSDDMTMEEFDTWYDTNMTPGQ